MSLSRSILITLLASLALLLPLLIPLFANAAIPAPTASLATLARAAASPLHAVEIQLAPDVKVGGEQVVLGDVATIYARNLSDFKALSTLVLSRIPDDKGEVTLPASYLEARLRSALPAGTDFALRAPASITFRLERLGLTSQDFSSEVERMARAGNKAPPGVELAVEPLGGLEQLKGLSVATARIEPSAEMAQWKGELSFKVSRADAVGAPTWVRAKVRWFRKAWVASRQLAFSETPAPEQFTEARIETTGLHEDPIGSSPDELASALKSSRFRRALAANAPLLPSSLDRRPDAPAGAALRVVFVSESGVRVSADGLLVQSGIIGGDVKARLKSSKKVVTGKLVAQGLVEVSL